MQELFDWAFAAEEPAGQKSSAAGGAGFLLQKNHKSLGAPGPGKQMIHMTSEAFGSSQGLAGMPGMHMLQSMTQMFQWLIV